MWTWHPAPDRVHRWAQWCGSGLLREAISLETKSENMGRRILIVVTLSLWKFPRAVTVSELAEGSAAHLQPFRCLVEEGKGRCGLGQPAQQQRWQAGSHTHLPTIHECPVQHVIVVLVCMQLRLQVGSCLTWLWLTLGLTHHHTPCVYSAVCWVIDWILLAFGLGWIWVLRLWGEREMPCNSSLSQLYLQNLRGFGLSQPSHTVDSLQVDGAFLMLVSVMHRETSPLRTGLLRFATHTKMTGVSIRRQGPHMPSQVICFK